MCNLDIVFDCLKGNEDLLSLLSGTILSSILSSYFWIIFLIQLIKTGNLDINSLILGTNEENNLFFIAIKDNPESNNDCYFFDDKNVANLAL